MICDYVKNLGRYKGISANLDKAIEWLLAGGAETLEGKVEIDGSNVYASKSNPALADINERGWENHFAYMDIHVAVKGSETLGFLNNPDTIEWTEIREQGDCELSKDPAAPETVTLKEGMCAIVWPGEPHKPNTGSGEYTKVVVKIKA